MNRYALTVIASNLIATCCLGSPITIALPTIELTGNGEQFRDTGILQMEPDDVAIASRVSASGANDADVAIVEAAQQSVRLWIGDSSGAHENWTSTFTVEFEKPLRGLAVKPFSPANSSDDVQWKVTWLGTDSSAVLQNSPRVSGQHSIFTNDGYVVDGPFESGQAFRLDDDNVVGGDSGGDPLSDLNIAIPSDPWSILLPDGVTSVTVEASLRDVVARNHALEGIGIDFGDVTVVPEPNTTLTWMVPAVLLFLRYGKRFSKKIAITP